METIELIRIFVKVVQTGSFTKAGEILKQPKSTISKSVARLEKESATKLLLRTTRSLTLTAAGRAFYDTCLPPIQVLEDARKSLHGQDSILSGLVRVTAPEDLGNYVISPAVAELTKKNSALNFELNYTDEIVDLIKDGYDVAVRIGRLTESNLKSKKIAEIFLIFVASPEFVKAAPRIKQPSDLKSVDCLTIRTRSQTVTLKNKNETAQIKIAPRIVSNHMTGLLNLAVSGAGVALVPHYLCRKQLEDGSLVRVLPDWNSQGLQVSLISPLATASSARLKVTIEHLAQAIQREFNRCQR